jgi:PKD repeat protein
MVILFMISRLRRSFALVVGLAGAALLTIACEKVPLLAPSGSQISLTALATALPANGTTDIIAQVIEASGTPPHSGTVVTFTTNLGTVQPSQAETDISGRVTVKYVAGASSGTATIAALSGGVSASGTNSIKILVGTAAIGRVVVNASPSLVPALGGTTTITALILDINGNPLSTAPVSFSTTAGTLANSVVNADQNGLAQTTLTTSATATVTASVGAQGGTSSGGTTPPTTPPTGTTAGQASGTVTVGIASSPTLVITPPTTGLTAGLPATFTFVVTAAAANGSAVRNVTVSWGDGQTQDLGAISGTATVSHVYRSAGSFVVSANLTDSAGNPVSTSTSVTVIPPALTLTITPPATLPSANLPANFTFAATAPAGDAVRDVTVNWGDQSAVQDLGAISGSVTVSHVFKAAGSYVISGTVTDIAGNSSGSSTSITVIPVPRPTIIITPSPVPGHVGTQTTLSIQVTTASGISVQDLAIDFGDGQHADLGGSSSASVPHVYTAQGTYTVTVTVVDSSGQTTIGSTAVSIGP